MGLTDVEASGTAAPYYQDSSFAGRRAALSHASPLFPVRASSVSVPSALCPADRSFPVGSRPLPPNSASRRPGLHRRPAFGPPPSHALNYFPDGGWTRKNAETVNKLDLERSSEVESWRSYSGAGNKQAESEWPFQLARSLVELFQSRARHEDELLIQPPRSEGDHPFILMYRNPRLRNNASSIFHRRIINISSRNPTLLYARPAESVTTHRMSCDVLF